MVRPDPGEIRFLRTAMLKRLAQWFKVYEDEIGLFAWTVVLFFLLRSSDVILNNYAETAFLKRYGVEYLPILYMINSIALFVIMALMTPMMARVQGARLLSYFFVICGGSAAAIRFLIPLGIDLIYPILFLLKAQFEVLLGLMFWNLANDLFNMRQSKRLFPLITAGGVFGQIVGSFSTPLLARAIMMDNLLLVYLFTTISGAAFVRRMETRYPTILLDDKQQKKTRRRSSMVEEFKKILPMMKESVLVKVLILITFLPNVVIPILNYQFNYAVNAQFATESGLIQFFSYFRGVLNIVSLTILLFVGRLYGRWGLPVALMFHPFNYVLAFLAFLLRFDALAAVYSRMSTMILRTTLNNPARNILMGLFPEAYRAVVRPFLRGTVVRIGLFLGSGIILISERFFHPRYLSLVAIPFVAAWILTIFYLKRRYSSILLGLISSGMLDLKSMEAPDIQHLFRDEATISQLTPAFLQASGKRSLWYARLLKSLNVEGLDTHLLSSLKLQDEQTKIGLLELLSGQAGEPAAEVLSVMAKTENAGVAAAAVKAANRLPPEAAAGFDYQALSDSRHPEVKAYALIGLYRREPDRYWTVIASWLDAKDAALVKAGVIAAGESGIRDFAARLEGMLSAGQDEEVLPLVLKALQDLKSVNLNALAQPYLSHPAETVREAALRSIEIDAPALMAKVVRMMGDTSESIHSLAKVKIEAAAYQNAQLLVESLSLPQRRIRKGIFDLLSSLNIKNLDIFRFARKQIDGGYQFLAKAERLRQLRENTVRDLFVDHLHQKKLERIENVLRVLAAQDPSGKLTIICRGVFSADQRRRSNALEALETTIDPRLFRIVIPLLEAASPAESLAVGRRHFSLPDAEIDPGAFLSGLLADEDWVTVVLTLNYMKACDLEPDNPGFLADLSTSENRNVRRAAQRIFGLHSGRSDKMEGSMQQEITLSDKVLLLKGIEIFEGLSVSELAAVASVTEEIDHPTGEIVIREGSTGETMYLVITGEVSVIKNLGAPGEIELDRIRSGDYFGEMALFENIARSASIRTEEDSRFLVLHKQEFNEIVREYPKIALEICKVLSGRIRKLHQKIQSREHCDLP